MFKFVSFFFYICVARYQVEKVRNKFLLRLLCHLQYFAIGCEFWLIKPNTHFETFFRIFQCH